MNSMKCTVGVLFLMIGIFLLNPSFASDSSDLDSELHAYDIEVDSEIIDKTISFVKTFLTP